jgi:hypothetical protein
MGQAGSRATDYGSAGGSAAHAAAAAAGGGMFGDALSGLGQAMDSTCRASGAALGRASEALMANVASYRDEDQRAANELSGIFER